MACHDKGVMNKFKLQLFKNQGIQWNSQQNRKQCGDLRGQGIDNHSLRTMTIPQLGSTLPAATRAAENAEAEIR